MNNLPPHLTPVKQINRARPVETEPGRWEVIGPDGKMLSVTGNECCAVMFAAGWNRGKGIL